MKNLFLFGALLILFSSCASIVSGTRHTMQLRSSDGESINVSVADSLNTQEATLPTAVVVQKAGTDIMITVNDKCYKKSTTLVPKRFDPWVLGNLVTGGTTGVTTDATNKTIWTYDDAVVVNAVPIPNCK